jgi:ArsR family transcriptional regulator, arsenate/arsenite/antimonite-responsive transcriptional repressor
MRYDVAMTARAPFIESQSAAASALAALGHDARLEIFRALVRAGDGGLPIYAIQQRLGGMPRSTLAHHLQMLLHADLVSQQKLGAEVVTTANYQTVRSLVSYLTDECCVDGSEAVHDGEGCHPGEHLPTSTR